MADSSFDVQRYGAGIPSPVLVLGGGGIVFVAWLAGYLDELERRGVAFGEADRIVGTSAGARLAGVLAAGRLDRFCRLRARLLARRPALIGALAPAADLTPSQQRGHDLFEGASDAGEPATIRAIGTAALAAATPSSRRRRRASALLTWCGSGAGPATGSSSPPSTPTPASGSR